MTIVHSTERFDRCLKELTERGGEAAIAVKKAELFISEIAREDAAELERRWRTKNGEARIDRCRKFYIGRRYRLVCIKHGAQVLLLYAGTHDECDRWLDNNRGTSFELEKVIVPAPSAPESLPPVSVTSDAQDGDKLEEPAEALSQKELRELFRGLWD